MANEIRHVRVGGTTYDIVGRVEGVRLSVSEGASASGSAQVAPDGTLDLSLTLPGAQGGTGGSGAATKPLAGMVVMFAGDSRFLAITDSASMATRMHEYAGCDVIDVVKNDCTTAVSSHGSSVVAQIEGYAGAGAPDAVVITGSINDAAYGVALGTHSDPGSEHDTSTYIGAVEHVIEYVASKWPACRVLWVRDNRIKLPSSLGAAEASAALAKIRQYEATLEAERADYGFEWVDFQVPQLNGTIPAVRERYFTNADNPRRPGYSGDGIHPNRDGHLVMARIIAAVLAPGR